MCKKLSRYLPSLLIIVVTVLILSVPSAQIQAAPVLKIEGTGLNWDVQINDWGNYGLVERYYSSNNNFNYHKIWKARGYDIFYLIGRDNLKTDQDYTVTFISALDGGRVSRTVRELQSLYYYPNFTAADGELVGPMLSFYRTAIFEPEYQELPDPAEVIRQDRALTEADRDSDAPRLMMGQRSGQFSDNNQSFFNKQVGCIQVGEKRPAGSDDKQTTDPKPGEDTTTKPGEGKDSGTSKSGEVEDKAEVKDKKDEDTAVSKDGNDKDNNQDEEKNSDEIEEGEDGADVTAPGAEEEDSPDTDESTGGETRKARWSWIAAGAVLVVGLAGGGIYYYIRRKGA